MGFRGEILTLSFFLWLFITLFLLCFWVWTIYAVSKQRQAWRVYAQKRKLRFHSNGLLQTPTLSGAISDYKVNIFASEHSELDARSNRRLTAIEVSLHTSLPISAAIASGGMVPIIEALDLHQEYRPPSKGWDDSYVLRSSNTDVMQAYMNEERIDHVLKLMKIDKTWIVLLYMEGQGLLRLDTPLPIDRPQELDKLIKKMIAVAKLLELQKGEKERLLRAHKTTSNKSSSVLEIDDGLLEDDIGLELDE